MLSFFGNAHLSVFHFVFICLCLSYFIIAISSKAVKVLWIAHTLYLKATTKLLDSFLQPLNKKFSQAKDDVLWAKISAQNLAFIDPILLLCPTAMKMLHFKTKLLVLSQCKMHQQHMKSGDHLANACTNIHLITDQFISR